MPPLSTRIAEYFGYEKKSANPPDYGQTSLGFPNPNWRFTGWGWNKSRSRTDYKAELGDLDGHSLVMCVVNYTGTRLPEAKPVVQRKGKDGKPDSDYLHPLCSLIRRPNQNFIWANYTLAMSVSWWISGNVYFLKVRNRGGTGDVVELYHIPDFLISPRWFGDGRSPEVPATLTDGTPSSTYLSHYEYRVPGREAVLYERSEIVHIKRGSDTLRRGGVSAFEPLIIELYGDNKMGEFTAAIMKSGGIQVPVFAPKDQSVNLNPTNAEHMKQMWIEKTTGDNMGTPVFNTIPLDMKMFGATPKDLDLSALRQVPESRIAAVCGIPAPTLGLMVGLQNGTSYASSEQARQQGYEEVIIPIQQAIAEEINWQLLPDFEKEGTAEFSFDTSKVRVLQEDQDSLMKRATVGYLGQVLKRDEAREMVGRDSDATDHVYYQPQSGQPTESTGMAGLAKASADVDAVISYLEKQADEFMVKE